MNERLAGSKYSRQLLDASRHFTPVNSESPFKELSPIILRLRFELMLLTRGYCNCSEARTSASIFIPDNSTKTIHRLHTICQFLHAASNLATPLPLQAYRRNNPRSRSEQLTTGIQTQPRFKHNTRFMSDNRNVVVMKSDHDPLCPFFFCGMLSFHHQ